MSTNLNSRTVSTRPHRAFHVGDAPSGKARVYHPCPVCGVTYSGKRGEAKAQRCAKKDREGVR